MFTSITLVWLSCSTYSCSMFHLETTRKLHFTIKAITSSPNDYYQELKIVFHFETNVLITRTSLQYTLSNSIGRRHVDVVGFWIGIPITESFGYFARIHKDTKKSRLYIGAHFERYTVVTKNWDTACKIVFVTRLRLVTVPRSPAWRTAAHSAPTNSIGEKSFYTAVLLPFFAVIADAIQDWRYRPIKSG